MAAHMNRIPKYSCISLEIVLNGLLVHMCDVYSLPIQVAMMDHETSHDTSHDLLRKFKEFREKLQPLLINFEGAGIETYEGTVREMYEEGKDLVQRIRLLLVKWRQVNNYPALVCDGDKGETLDDLQKLFEEASDALADYVNCFEVFSYPRDSFETLKNELVSMSLIIENYPPQTVKIKDGKGKAEAEEALNVTIRCLLPLLWDQARPNPDIAMQNIDRNQERQREVKCTKIEPVIYESNADNFGHWNRIKLSVNVKGAKPTRKSDTFMYIMKFEFRNPKIVLHSLPILFYTHTTQIPVVSGYAMWFTAFTATKVQDPFVLSDEVILNQSRYEKFGSVFQVLDKEFHRGDSVLAKSLKSPGRSDTPEHSAQSFTRNSFNKKCLMKMLKVSNDDDNVRLEDLLKVKCGHEQKFTVWEWFFACYKTKYEYLNDMYEAGLIMGFIWKDDAGEELQRQYVQLQHDMPGATLFLIRFSTNYLDHIHGLISPSIARGPQAEHGRPIKSSKYKNEDKKLGKVLCGEMAVDDSKLFVLNLQGNRLRFLDAFSNFMEETDNFNGYNDLREFDNGSHATASIYGRDDVMSPASSASEAVSDVTLPGGGDGQRLFDDSFVFPQTFNSPNPGGMSNYSPGLEEDVMFSTYDQPFENSSPIQYLNNVEDM